MSASDLAPFVAAIIDDGIAPELQRKNEKLQRKNEKKKRKINALESKIQDLNKERLLVQITGQHGRPIYGETSLKHGKSYLNDEDFENRLWLEINNENDAYNVIICPLDEEHITQLEIRVGGMLIMPLVLEQLDRIAGFDDEEHDDEDDLDKLVYLSEVNLCSGAAFDDVDDLNDDDCPINRLLGRVGPITVRHYKALCNRILYGIGIFTRDLFEHNVLPTTKTAGAQPTRKMTLEVTEIEFHKNNISGCISLMKEMGICTLRPPG